MSVTIKKEEFIGETIMPVPGTMDTTRMAAGEPGLPREFVWRKKNVGIVKVLRQWKETGSCTHGSTDRYISKHWYEILTNSGDTMQIYFERRPRRGAAKRDWRLFSIIHATPRG